MYDGLGGGAKVDSNSKIVLAADDATRLVLELQTIARNAGHPVPLMIAIDQENGGVNSLFDEVHIRQFPSAMGVAATGSKQLARRVANATAQELKAVGVNWIMGPVLDVLTNVRNQPLGPRTFGDDPHEVSEYGVEYLKGYQEAGLATCGKHFPSYGNLEFLGSQTDVPVIKESLEQLSLSALVPFRNAISHGIDAMMVGGVAMSSEGVNVMHACLSEQVVHELLRRNLGFNGVIVSECLEMEALTHNIGVGGGTVMAVKAGCDLILSCHSHPHQKEAMAGLRQGVENGMISREQIRESLRRVLAMKSRCTSWQAALNPGGIPSLMAMQPSHAALSAQAYDRSITLVKDKAQFLPLPRILEPDEELLILSPLLKPLAASAISQSILDMGDSNIASSAVHNGEKIFMEFGRSLTRQRLGRVLHTSYTSTGVRPIHENLIDRAGAVIVITADANRNLYQTGFTKHVSMICKSQGSSTGSRAEKPLVVVSVGSPYDFATDPAIGTQVCTYDVTETALQTLVRVLMGDLTPSGTLPGTVNRSQKLHQSRQHWLVESWNEERDSAALDVLLSALREQPASQPELTGITSRSFLLHRDDVEEDHFVVRNSTTQTLYGFCSTYYFKSTGTAVIGALVVDPSRRNLSIGHSLHRRAIQALLQRPGVKRFQLGSRLPSIYLGIPAGNPVERKRLRQWFSNLGWNTALSRPVCSVILRSLTTWTPPDGLIRSLQNAEVCYDMVQGWGHADDVLDHVRTSSRQGVLEMYKLALEDEAHAAIIRAKRAQDGRILGTLAVYDSASTIAQYVPGLKTAGAGGAAGMSSPVISPSVGEYAMLMQGLILLGIRHARRQGAKSVILDCVSFFFFPSLFQRMRLIQCQVDGDGHFDSLSAMGFDVLHSYEEVTCDAASWRSIGLT